MHITSSLLIPICGGIYLLGVHLILGLCQLKGFEGFLDYLENT